MVRVLLSLVLLAAISCGRAEPARDTASPGATPSRPVAPDAGADPPRIVALGDSLTAGLGLPEDQAYPALLQARASAEGYDVQVVNAGVSGDTTADGLRRTDWALEGDVRLLIVALGANDGLRGLPVAPMKANLEGIIAKAQARRIPVVLAGMEAPPNYGERYASAFRQVFNELAREQDVAFIPFLLDGVAGDPALNQRDGIHPNRAGAARIAEHVWPAVRTILGANVP